MLLGGFLQVADIPPRLVRHLSSSLSMHAMSESYTSCVTRAWSALLHKDCAQFMQLLVHDICSPNVIAPLHVAPQLFLLFVLYRLLHCTL